jgi:hypothetical protein
LLTQLRETKVKGGQRETGVDQIGFDPLKRVPKFPLCAEGGIVYTWDFTKYGRLTSGSFPSKDAVPRSGLSGVSK